MSDDSDNVVPFHPPSLAEVQVDPVPIARSDRDGFLLCPFCECNDGMFGVSVTPTRKAYRITAITCDSCHAHIPVTYGLTQ